MFTLDFKLLFTKMIKGILCFCLLFIWVNKGAAQQVKYKTYSVDEGLSQISVWDVLVDHKGFLWIATADGINRFDGNKMELFKGNKNAKGLIGGDYYYHFYEDSKNRFWLSSTHGLGYFDAAKNDFISFRVSHQIYTFMGEQKPGELWVMVGSEKVIMIDLVRLKVVDSIMVNCPLTGIATMQNAVSLPNYFVVVLQSTMLLVVNKKTHAFKLVETKVNNGSFIIKMNDSTVISMFNTTRQIFHISDTGVTIKVEQRQQFKEVERVTDCLIWNKEFLLSTAKGMYILDSINYELKRKLPEPYSVGIKGINYYQCLYQDKRGNLYMGMNGSGLKIWSPYSHKFKHYATPNEQTNMIKSFVKMPNQVLYAGLFDKGIMAYHLMHGDSQEHCFKGTGKPINTIPAMMQLDAEHIVFGEYNNIYVWNVTSKKIVQKITIGKNATPGYQHFQRFNGKFFFSYDSIRSGFVAMFSLQNNKVETLFKLNNAHPSCFTFLNNGNCLFGTRNGLFIYDLVSKKIISTNIKTHIKSILKTSTGQYFVATLDGLFLLNNDFNAQKCWNENSGLPNSFLYAVLEDKNGDLWMSHNRGISCLNLKTNQFRNYKVLDGLQSNEFNTGAYYKDEKGLLYFGGINGFNIIDPNNIPEDKRPVATAINQINVNDIEIKSDTAFNEISLLSLNYEQNTISFSFSALEFCRPEACKYRYKLEGYDNQWIESASVHFARYANIAPGQYTFKILACNPDGYWARSPKELHIFIKAPFWQTTPFRVAMLLILILLIVFSIRAILHRQKVKATRQLEIQKELEAERVRISRDLHDNVGAHLSYLINNIDWMKEHPHALEEYEKSEKLKLLSEAGRNALHTLRQTIWAFSQSAISVDDFADRFKQFALKMLDLNESVSIQFKEQLETSKQLNPSVALNLFRIAQEAFNNSLKHSKCTEVEVLFKSNHACLMQICIKDNGIGFVPEKYKDSDSYGLQNMEARTQEIGAELHIDSLLGKGTTVMITIKNTRS